MRKGKILVEGDPKRLMNVYNYNSLEDLFTSLSAMQENRDHSVPIEPVRLVSKSEELRVSNNYKKIKRQKINESSNFTDFKPKSTRKIATEPLMFYK